MPRQLTPAKEYRPLFLVVLCLSLIAITGCTSIGPDAADEPGDVDSSGHGLGPQEADQLLKDGFQPLHGKSVLATGPVAPNPVPTDKTQDATQNEVKSDQAHAEARETGEAGESGIMGEASPSMAKTLPVLECSAVVKSFGQKLRREGLEVLTKQLKVGVLVTSKASGDERFLFLAPSGVLNPPGSQLRNSYFRCVDEGNYYDGFELFRPE